MKLHEVLNIPGVASGDLWFRPVWWPQGYAYRVKHGDCYAVPSPSGGVLGIVADAKTLAGNWEAVTPAQVCN